MRSQTLSSSPIRLCLSALAIALALWLAAPAHAATIRVESGCTLAQAFESALTNTAPSGSTCAAGDASGATAEDTIVLTGDVTVSAAVAINADTTGVPWDITTAIRFRGNGHVISRTAGNHLVLDGGAKLKLTIDNVVFRGNRTGDRGAVQWIGGDLFVRNSVFEGFAASAVSVSQGGRIIAEDSIFRNNSGSFGSAFYSTASATQRFTRIVFSGNSASDSGGAIGSESALVIEDSSFIGNSATLNGGAIWIANWLTVRNSTFVGNSAAQGAVVTPDRNSQNVDLRFEHITATGNTVTTSTGAVIQRFPTGTHTQSITLRILNSVITGNTGNDCYGWPTTITDPVQIALQQEDILIASSYVEDGSCGATITSADNSPAFLGPQQMTGRGHAYFVPLKSGQVEETDPLTGLLVTRTVPSPLIDAGAAAHCLARDQLGRSRSVGASCDLGAIEVQPPPRPVRRAVETRSSGPKPFRETCKTDLPLGISLSATPRGIQCQALTPAGVGNDAVIAAGYLAAVDIWGDIGDGLEVCFDQAGRLLLLDAATAPRTLVGLSLTRSDNVTCAWLDRAGTVVLLPAESALVAASRSSEPAVALSNCRVTTMELLNFRSAPAIGDNIIGYIRAGASLQAEARTSRWFRVTAAGLTGWISPDFVASAGSCGA